MRSPPLPSSISRCRAWLAASKVPEIAEEMWIETTSLPASSSGCQTAMKSPTEGCEVVAPPLDWRSRL